MEENQSRRRKGSEATSVVDEGLVLSLYKGFLNSTFSIALSKILNFEMLLRKPLSAELIQENTLIRIKIIEWRSGGGLF